MPKSLNDCIALATHPQVDASARDGLIAIPTHTLPTPFAARPYHSDGSIRKTQRSRRASAPSGAPSIRRRFYARGPFAKGFPGFRAVVAG
jgi:hypothetical protein